MLLLCFIRRCSQVFFFLSSSASQPYKITISCHRGGGDLLRQLHHLSEAESKLSTHQKKLSEIEAKVDLEHPLIFSRIKAKSFKENLFLVLIRKVSLYANW
jgi:ABC-type Fe3+-citrate transport system substrate-binding protein